MSRPILPSELPAPSRPSNTRLVPIRRAARACNRCRARKVRCDVTLKAGDCTNCSLDGVECRVGLSESSKSYLRKGSSRNSSAQLHSFPRRTLDMLLPDESLGPHFQVAVEQEPFYAMPGQVDTPPKQSSELNSLFTLPDFMQDLSITSVEDLDFLRCRAVFSLPEHTFQQTVLERYAEFVHPLLPIIDFAEFYDVVTSARRGPKIPLLLYFAVMFAGVGAMEADLVLRQAFMSKQAVRESIYKKAQTLVDMEVEKDRLVICQASLLLLAWPFKNLLKDPSFWLGNAISQAHSLGLHRFAKRESKHASRNEATPDIRRLLWWGILFKESDLCMSVGQPPRVWPFATPMLSLGDFGLADNDTQKSNISQADLHVRSQTLSKAQAMVCIQKAKLCLHTYRIMRHIHEDTVMSNSQPKHGLCASLREYLAEDLYSWHSDIPNSLSWQTLVRPGLSAGEQRSVAWAMTVVELIYLAAHSMLYVSTLTRSYSGYKACLDLVATTSPPSEYNWCFLRHSASALTEVLERLIACDFAKFLPPSSLVNLCLTGSTVFREVASAGGGVTVESLWKFELSVEASKVMADHVPGLGETIVAMRLAKSAMRKPAP